MPEVLLPNSPQIVAARHLLAGYDSMIGLNGNGQQVSDEKVTQAKESIGGLLKGDYLCLPHPTYTTKEIRVTCYPFSADQAKLVYYLNGVLSTLFPFNFLRVNAAFGMYYTSLDDQEQSTGLIMEKALPEQSPNMAEEVKRFIQGEPKKHPFADAIKTINNLGCYPEIYLYPSRLITADNGGEYYPEPIRNLYNDFKTEETLDYMRKQKFPDSDIQSVAANLKRITYLRTRFGRAALDPNSAVFILMNPDINSNPDLEAAALAIVDSTVHELFGSSEEEKI